MGDDNDEFFNEDKNNNEIRTELSQMSFEKLQKLKEKLGEKVYNEAIFGTRQIENNNFKRENKNRPREMSAKKQVPRFKEIIPIKKKISRDPRFDSLCGTYDHKVFKNSYKFVDKLRENDLKTLKTELEETNDFKLQKKIKYLVQRLENQIREDKKKKQHEQVNMQQKKDIIEAIKYGTKPNYKNKSEKKVLELISQYEELKNLGKVKKYIQRLRKKKSHKHSVRLNTENSNDILALE